MTEEEYKAAIEQYKAEHSAGGSLEHGEWKKHKYIRIENGRYIYPEDLKKNTSDKKASVQGKIDEFESSNQKYVKLGKAGDKSIVTGKPMTQEELDSMRYGSANLAEAKKVNEARHDKTLSGELKKGQGTVPDELYERNKVNLEGATRTIHELKKENARLAKDLKNLEELEKHQEAAQKYQDAKDREIKKEQQARQEETKKITSMTPEEARKRAAELAGKAQTETPKKESGVGVTVVEKKEGILEKPKQEESVKSVGGNRDMSISAQEKAKKVAEEKVQAKKNEYLELGKKNGLTDSDVDNFIKIAEYNYNWRKDTAMRHATSRAKDYGDNYTVKLEPHEHGSMEDIVIYRPDGSRLSKFVSIENLESDIQNQLSRGKESPYYKQKVQHSYTDPKAFYAAVYDYKQAHKR